MNILTHNNTKSFVTSLLSITSVRYPEMKKEHPNQMHIFTIQNFTKIFWSIWNKYFLQISGFWTFLLTQKTCVFYVSFNLIKVTWPCCCSALASATLPILNVKQNWWGVFLLIATCEKIIIFSVLDNMLWHLGLAKLDLPDLSCCQFWSDWCGKTKGSQD